MASRFLAAGVYPPIRMSASGLRASSARRLIAGRARSGCPAAWRSLLASELDAEHRLKPSRNVLLRSHRAECRAGRGNVGDAETGLVEDVKRVDAGFQTQALVNLNVLD